MDNAKLKLWFKNIFPYYVYPIVLGLFFIYLQKGNSKTSPLLSINWTALLFILILGYINSYFIVTLNKFAKKFATFEANLGVYKIVCATSNFYKSHKLCTQEGLKAECDDSKLTAEINEEYKYVYNKIQGENQNISPEVIRKSMADFYKVDEEKIAKIIKEFYKPN